MLEDNKNGLEKVEEMKRKLFSRSYETRIEDREGFVFFKKEKVPENWDHTDLGNEKSKNDNRSPFFKNFFIFSIIFFICTLGYLFFTFFVGKNDVSNENIEIAVLGNTFTGGGEELPLIIEITNKNSAALELADLVIEYPKGSTLNSTGDIERLRQSLGVIPAGSIKNENMKVVLFGERGSIHEIKISLEYRLEGSNAIFVKDKLYKVTINSTPINLSVDAPTEITPNQDLTIIVKATLNDTKPSSDLVLKLDYPFGFEFASAEPSPSVGNNVWNLGDLPAGAEREIVIKGQMVDVYDGESKIFHVFTGPEQKGDKGEVAVVFNSLAHNILIKKPFIEAKLFVNADYQREYSVDTKKAIVGSIRWVNNLDTQINDLEIKARFSGNAFDWKKIDIEKGFYDSNNTSIVWDKNNEENFAVVKPFDSGIVGFSLEPFSVFSPTTGNLLVDPIMNIEISISGKQATGGNTLRTVESVEVKTIKIVSDVSMLSKLEYSKAPFVNTGPLPPKAEKETTYTVTWSIANTANNVSKVKVVATLPPRVNFKNLIFPKNEDITFNSSTREVVWNVGNLTRGAGIISSLREASFQVSYTPSLSEVGLSPVLVNQATLTGHDDFANVDINLTKASLQIAGRIVE